MPQPSTSGSLYNVEIEGHCLSLLIQEPSVYSDFSLINDADFSNANRPIFQVIQQQLNQTPQGSVTPLVVSEKLKGYGITIEGFDPYDYLEGLRLRLVKKEDAAAMAMELKRLTVRRQLIARIEDTKKELVTKPNATFADMTGLVERNLTGITTDYCKTDVTEVMGNLIEVIEKRGEKPLTATDSGFLGPFPSINTTIASLTYPSSYVVIGARSSTGKSSFGWFYNTHILEKYPNTHLLHLDAAEMPYEELCWRAVCCLSGGRIPYWAVFRGEWRKNQAWTRLIRDELWPRVKAMANRMSYKNIGSMSGPEQIAFIRRYYYNKVGRDGFLIIHYDYLKGMETFNQKSEHQAIGNFVNAQKTLITDDIPNACIWTSVQANRLGVVTNKKPEEINDSEDTFSLSDRILQMSTHSFSLRFKSPAELAVENNGAFGNLKLTPLKKRQLLGEKYKEMLIPVKLPNGRFAANYFNVNTKDFWYQDKGSLVDMLQVLGQAPVRTANNTQLASPL